MNKGSLPNPRHEVKPQVLTIYSICSISNFQLGLTWPGRISWIQLMFTCVSKKKGARLGIYYVGQGNDLCDAGSPSFSLALEMGRAIFEHENVALGGHQYLTLSIFP